MRTCGVPQVLKIHHHTVLHKNYHFLLEFTGNFLLKNYFSYHHEVANLYNLSICICNIVVNNLFCCGWDPEKVFQSELFAKIWNSAFKESSQLEIEKVDEYPSHESRQRLEIAVYTWKQLLRSITTSGFWEHSKREDTPSNNEVDHHFTDLSSSSVWVQRQKLIRSSAGDGSLGIYILFLYYWSPSPQTRLDRYFYHRVGVCFDMLSDAPLYVSGIY